MGIIEQYDKGLRFTSIVNYIALSIQYLAIWISLKPTNFETLKTYCALIVLEFVFVHSGVFMFAFAKMRFTLPIFILFYGLFAYGINKTLSTNSVMITYMTLMLYRMRTIFFKPKEVYNYFIYSFKVAFIYVCLMLLLVYSRNILPEFGVTGNILPEESFKFQEKSINETHPHVLIAFGTFYYGILAYIEYKTLQKIKEQNITK